jgi:hypothetical protein
MQMKLFGYKCRLEVIVICIILGIFIGVNTMCGCNCNKEGFVSPSRPSQVSDNGMSVGVPGQNTGDESWRKHMSNNSETQMNTNDTQSMSFFADTVFKPDCCSYSSYSGSGGCACITSEQSMLLGNRGNNCSGSDCTI